MVSGDLADPNPSRAPDSLVVCLRPAANAAEVSFPNGVGGRRGIAASFQVLGEVLSNGKDTSDSVLQIHSP
jgi:hypothetical protein